MDQQIIQRDFDTEVIMHALQHQGFYVIKQGLSPNWVSKARHEYLNTFHQLPLHAPREGFTVDDLRDKPWRKLAIGARNGLGEAYAQFLQTTYFHEQNAEHPYLKQLFSFMITLRNRLLALPADFGSCPERDLFWNACRVHHYPCGGGFMMAHKDTYFPSVLKKSGFPFLQIMIPLSLRNEDFVSGGGFIVPKDSDQPCFFETSDSLGDMVLFDGGNVVHGVEDVDSDRVVDFQSRSGRFAAFVNVYKV